MTIELTDEMRKAYEIIANSNDNVFITGKAGSGKTTFLKHLISNVNKKFIVTAPTGVAAINAKGVTLHSQFNIPIGFISPDTDPAKRYNKTLMEICRSFDVLVIDEISMVRPDVIDYIDRTLRMYRSSGVPFGGVQVVMLGDLFQLSPVVKQEEQKIMLNFYEGFHFFFAAVWEEKGFHIFEFTKVFRQNDDRLVKMLNNIREYIFTKEDKELLASLRDEATISDYNNGYVHLCSKRATVADINDRMLGEPDATYTSETKGEFSPSSKPCEDELKLRVGCRVMILVNDANKVYHNGSTGTVMGYDGAKVRVKLDNGLSVNIEKNTWREMEYKIVDGEVKQYEKGSFTQFPLALAYACTIHKSQGLTFDKVALHVGHIFSPGQLYVALSRCRTLEGIAVDSLISKRHIIKDEQLVKFYTAIHKTGDYFNKHTLKYII